MSPVIDLQGVDFYYGKLPVLTGIDLQVMEGEFIGVVGPNAGGKSTLLKLLLGLLQPDAGKIRVLGRKPSAASHLLGYLPQFKRVLKFATSQRFEPLLPDDEEPTPVRAAALAHWCEGFLHGLVSAEHGDALKERLAAEPLADIIRDMLEITRAGADEDGDSDSDEEAYAELVEYLRVAAQLTYEELAEMRKPAVADKSGGPEALH